MSKHRQSRHWVELSVLNRACLHKYCVWNEITGVFFPFLHRLLIFQKVYSVVRARILFFVASHSTRSFCVCSDERSFDVRDYSISARRMCTTGINSANTFELLHWSQWQRKLHFAWREKFSRKSNYCSIHKIRFEIERTQQSTTNGRPQVTRKISFKTHSIRNERKIILEAQQRFWHERNKRKSDFVSESRLSRLPSRIIEKCFTTSFLFSFRWGRRWRERAWLNIKST